MNTGLDLALHQTDEGVFVHLVVAEGSDEGRKDAPEQGIGHGLQDTV
jgi:hypothetical protein